MVTHVEASGRIKFELMLKRLLCGTNVVSGVTQVTVDAALLIRLAASVSGYADMP